MARGSKKGSVWLYGRARRVDPKWRRDYLVAIGRRLRDVRLEQSVAVAELAAAAGTHPATIHSIEGGRRGMHGPSVWLVCKLAIALGRSPSEIMP